MIKVLLIDDEKDLCWSIGNVLEKSGYKVRSSYDGTDGMYQIREFFPDAVILDLNLPDIDGLSLLAKIKEADPDIPVIILTGYAEIKSAVQAMKLGASDYLAKPFDNEELLLSIEKAVKEQLLKREVDILRHHVIKEIEDHAIVSKGPVMQELIKKVKQVAGTDMTVVLQGESGSGKEVLARLIHRYSLRKLRPFVTVDCSSIPESLAESELFGYEKGAFTGADRKKLGQFELAHQGTIFLDEIGNLSMALQGKFLRVLEERNIQHLGGKRDIHVDVRVIVATNLDLSEAVRKKSFRGDLFHRLNEFLINVPPLRERTSEIPALSDQFLKEANLELGKRIRGFSVRVMDMFAKYDWPGNIRELKNVIKRAVLLSEVTVKPEHISSQIRSGTQASSKVSRPLKRSVHEAEKELIKEALLRAGGNRSRAARLLGIDRKTLYNKLDRYKIKMGSL